jgi:hypothetical protein
MKWLKMVQRNGWKSAKADQDDRGVERFETADDLRHKPAHMTHSGHFLGLRNLATINCRPFLLPLGRKPGMKW